MTLGQFPGINLIKFFIFTYCNKPILNQVKQNTVSEYSLEFNMANEIKSTFVDLYV